MSAFRTFIARLGRFGSIYASGLAVQLVFGLGTTLVEVHMLAPALYGGLTLYLLVPSVIAVLSNLGILSGTMAHVFGQNDDGDLIEDDSAAESEHMRKALMTGLVISLVIGAILVIAAGALTSPLAHLLGRRPNAETLILIGALSGVLAGGWRMLNNMLRYASRPVAYAVVHVSRAAFSLVAVTLLLIAGYGVLGVIEGFAIGTALAFAVSIFTARRDLELGFHFHAVKKIFGYAKGWVVVVLAYYIIQSFGVLILSMHASARDVGLFSFASSITVLAHYSVSAFVYAWGSLMRSPLRVAVIREHGEARSNASLLEGYFVAASVMVVAFAAFSCVAVKLAPSSYGAAAPLVPLLVLTPVGRGCFQLTYSLSPRHDKRKTKIKLAALAIIVYFGANFFLAGPFKAVGVGASAAIAFFIPAGIQLLLGQRSDVALPLNWLRMLGAPLLATAATLGIVFLHLGFTLPDLALATAIFVGFVALLLALGIVPREALGLAKWPVQRLRERRASRGHAVRDEILALAPTDAGLLAALVRGESPAAVAAARGESEMTILVRFMTIVRALAGIDGAPSIGWRVARYLLFSGASGQRHYVAVDLIENGADPLVIDQLDQLMNVLRRVPRRVWRLAQGTLPPPAAAAALVDSLAAPVAGTPVPVLAAVAAEPVIAAVAPAAAP